MTGTDDAGVTSAGTVTFMLGSNESKQITAQDLENGNSNKGLTGTLQQVAIFHPNALIQLLSRYFMTKQE